MNHNSNKSFAFTDLYQALNYFRYKNPARAKYVNILELETGANSYGDDFTGDHPNDIWASVAIAIKNILKQYNPEYQKAFILCDLNSERINPEEAAQDLGYSVRMINIMRAKIKDDLIRELKRRELLTYND